MKTEHLQRALLMLADLVKKKKLESIGKVTICEFTKNVLEVRMDMSDFKKAFAGRDITVHEDGMGVTYKTAFSFIDESLEMDEEERLTVERELKLINFSSFSFKRAMKNEVKTITLPHWRELRE